MIRTLTFLSLVSLVGLLSAADSAVDLRYRSYRNWDIDLPAERWFPINKAIQIGEGDSALRFAVEMLGNDLRFDTDGDGELDRTIKPLVDKKTHVSTTRVVLSGTDQSGDPVRYAVRLRDDANGWEWAPGGAMVGTIESEGGPMPVKIIDQNGNGRYDDFGSDAMIVGASDHAMFLSKTILVDDQLRAVAVDSSGMALQLSDHEGPTAKVDMTTSFASKAVLLSAVILSSDRQHSFDVGSASGPIEIPAGNYTVAGGLLGLGSHRVTLGPGKMAPLELAAGKAKTIDWGGPAKTEFRFARRGNELLFSSQLIRYYGNAGEEYSGWRPIGKSPEFRVLDSATGAVLEVAILPGSC